MSGLDGRIATEPIIFYTTPQYYYCMGKIILQNSYIHDAYKDAEPYLHLGTVIEFLNHSNLLYVPQKGLEFLEVAAEYQDGSFTMWPKKSLRNSSIGIYTNRENCPVSRVITGPDGLEFRLEPKDERFEQLTNIALPDMYELKYSPRPK